jgi:hypothetical protein
MEARVGMHHDPEVPQTPPTARQRPSLRPNVAGPAKCLLDLGVRPGHDADVRFPRLFIGMNGVKYSAHDAREHSYRAELDKSCFLRFAAPIIAATAIPRPWLKSSSVNPVTHARLAASIGYKWRESYTRNAGNAPRLIGFDPRYKRAVKGCIYRYLFPEGEQYKLSRRKKGVDWDEDAETFAMPTAHEMRANAEFQKYWQANSRAWALYFWTPGWIFDARTPGTPYNKLVLIALASFGLFALDAHGHCKGEMQQPNETIGSRVGLSADAVQSALSFYQKLGLIQVVEHVGRYFLNKQPVRGGWEKDGMPVKKGTEGEVYIEPPAGALWRQPPNTIYYVAGREFDNDKVLAEQARFREAVKAVQSSIWSMAIEDIHRATLGEWWHTRQL